MRSLLGKETTKMRNIIKAKILKLHNLPSITADIWSDKSLSHSYIGVTLHFVETSSKNLNRINSAFLGLREIFGSHTAQLVKETVSDILDEYGLNLEKEIFKVVSDNGANFKCAFKEKQMSKFFNFLIL
jgi:hypothetical protein